MSTFICADCGKEFNDSWSENEREAEFKDIFPTGKVEDTVLLCTPCFDKIMAKAKEAGLVP